MVYELFDLNRALPSDTVDATENCYLEEAGLEEEEEEEEEEDEVQTRKKVKKTTRQRWTDDEVKEIKEYFKDFLKSGTTPRSTFIDRMKQKSKVNKGVIHLRENHLIIKKISNMNHSKK